jgi:T-complex protein 1 subunit gamma
LTELRAKHAKAGEGLYFGINGNTGKIENMKDADIWDPISVKLQTLKTSIESACMLLRIDDIVSGIKKDRRGQAGQGQAGGEDEQETFGDNRDG